MSDPVVSDNPSVATAAFSEDDPVPPPAPGGTDFGDSCDDDTAFVAEVTFAAGSSLAAVMTSEVSISIIAARTRA